MSAYSNRIIADGASNFWRLNEPSGTSAVDVISAANGTISGGVTLAQPGALSDGDKAMSFNGTTGQIVTAANVAIPLTVTCEAWVKKIGAAAQPIPIFHEANNSPLFCLNGFNLAVYDNNNSVAAAIGTLPSDGAWHHLVYVLNGSTFTSYTDGVSNGSVAAVRTTVESAPARIGWSSDNGTFWLGSLDEVAIYPRALSAGEIRAHYDARTLPYLPGSYPAKVIQDGASNFWRLDEASGTTAVDVIGAANGTISGGVSLAQPGALSDGDPAMAFNGTTGQILTAAAVTIPVTATIEAWIKATGDVGTYRGYLSTRVLASEAGELLLAVMNVRPILYSNGANITGIRTVTDGQWHHLVWVINGSQASIYVDGVLDFTASFARPTFNLRPLGMSLDNAGGANIHWPGSLDEVAIYPVALTAAQIAAHYQAGKASSTASWFPSWQLLKRSPDLEAFNIWEAVAPSDTVDLRRGPTGGLWVGTGGDVAAVIGNNTVPAVFASVPSGAWLPIAARRINSSGTTATGILALYQV